MRGEAILDVRAIGGYEPTQGRRFNLLLITTATGEIIGEFDTVLPPDTWNVIYEDDAVVITPIDGACPDLDGSGDIGFGDVLIVLGSWGPCSGCDGDVDGNEIVDFEDLLLILSIWGPCDG